MKILHVILELLESNGGPPRGLTNLARAQAARGDDVIVLPCRKTAGPQTLYPGREGNLTCHEPVTDSKLFWRDGALVRVLHSLARDRDIVHIHGTWRYHVRAAAAAAKSFGVPYLVRPAGNLGFVTRSHKMLRKRLYFALIERRVLNAASAIHCCSEKEREELSVMSLRTRLFVIPQPVVADILRIPADETALGRVWPEAPKMKNIVLYLGRICAIKNLEVLVEAFIRVWRDFPDWHLVLAGPHEEPDLVARLKSLAEQMRAPDVLSLPGMVSGGVKTALLTRAKIFAQSSQHENFGMSVAEALMFGLPCVVSDGVALGREIVEAGAGLTAKSEPMSFEAALRKLMGDEETRRRCAIQAVKLAQRYDSRAVAEDLAREYERCLKERP